MPYSIFKTIHIVIAAMMLISLLYVCYEWLQNRPKREDNALPKLAIIPLGFVQLITGFAIISVKQYDYHAFWIIGSIIGFIILISAWVLFICAKRSVTQLMMLSTTLVAILNMIFLMVNQSIIP